MRVATVVARVAAVVVGVAAAVVVRVAVEAEMAVMMGVKRHGCERSCQAGVVARTALFETSAALIAEIACGCSHRKPAKDLSRAERFAPQARLAVFAHVHSNNPLR